MFCYTCLPAGRSFSRTSKKDATAIANVKATKSLTKIKNHKFKSIFAQNYK